MIDTMVSWAFLRARRRPRTWRVPLCVRVSVPRTLSLDEEDLVDVISFTKS